MNKKTRPLMIIMIFLLAVVMPFIKVDAVVILEVSILNPNNGQSFSYYTTNEVFEGYSLTQGLTPSFEYGYGWIWSIDGVHLDSGSGSKVSSVDGNLGLRDEFDIIVDITNFDVGEHSVKLYVRVNALPDITEDDVHSWSRDEVPPTPIPTVEFENPEENYEYYDASVDTEYQISFYLWDEDNNINSLYLYVNDVLDHTFTSYVRGSRSWEITVAEDEIYLLEVNGTDSDANVFSETISFTTDPFYITAGTTSQYFNQPIDFESFTSSSPNGLHNMSYSVGDYGYFDENVTSNNANVVMDTTWGYDCGLLNWSQYIHAVDIDYGDTYTITANWYDTDWLYRVPLTITYSAVETYATVNHTITTSDPVYARDKANGDDWVVTESDGQTVCSHWIEIYDSGGDSILWFNATSLSNGDTTYYLYYSNSGASNSENPSNVFDAWDNFDDGYSDNDALDTLDRGWIIDSGTPIINDVGGSSMVAEFFVDDSENTFETAYNQFTLNVSNAVVHYDIWFSDGDTGQTYISGSEGIGATSNIVLFRMYDDNSIFNYNGAAYVELTPAIDLSLSTWYDFQNRITGTTDYDIYVDEVNHDGDIRDTPTVGIDRYQFQTADSGDGDLTLRIDNFWAYSFLSGMVASTGSEEVGLTAKPSITITEDGNDTGLSTKGDSSWGIVFTASETCLVTWVNIIVVIYETIFEVYSISTNTIQTNSFTLNDSAWAGLSEGQFKMNFSLFNDLDSYLSTNLTYYKDVTSPVVELRSPQNRTIDDPYSNLQIISLSYKITETNPEALTNDMKTLIIDGESFTGDEWLMYPKHKPLIFYEGLHTLNITARDYAGNEGKASVSFYYRARLDKSLTLIFTSSIDDEIINAEQYLNIYLDDMPISAVTTTNLNEFTVKVKDKFGILLNETAFNYTAIINIDVPLRPVLFENNNEIYCEYMITYGLFAKSFWIDSAASETYYLNDSSYILVAEAGNEYFNETHWYGRTYIPFTVKTGMDPVEVTLNLISDDPLHNPLLITLYDKSTNIIGGFIHIYYETSWGNTTIGVKDNDVFLGDNKTEGWRTWLFDTEEYGLHNITIFIYNGEEVVFSDGFSFTLIEPEENPNYYLSISTSVDVSGGLFYVTINTDWDNCTIRVFDNLVPLGGNVSEGSSVWSFDETSYGLHNFTIEVYQGNDLWDTIITSITIVAPDAETLSLTHYSVQFDSGSSQIYINYQTTWGNTTVEVFDNESSLGSAVSGEEISIWTTTSVYGLHNITVIIYDDGVEWFTDVFSFTIVEPSEESNYYEVFSISVDADAGQLFTSIHTHWGNCTIGVKDNSTWLGDNVTEGNIIWTFSSTSYGLHNFSIIVYQNDEEWHTFYTSITIVEPIPEADMLFTLFEKSVDADSGLFYLNYETNWGNTTCGVKDNSTWLGDNTTEQLSIWSFTTSYGFHNITIEIYNGNDLVYTDVTSFVIQEPSAEYNYFLVVDTSIDVSSGLMYVTIETYFGNCTIGVKDNSTWLGDNTTEGSSVWSFTTGYGLHSFSIYVYQGLDTWSIVYTSTTIVEPPTEINYYLTIETSIDVGSGLFYVTVNTYWDNCTVRVKDNETWLGSAVDEGSSTWEFNEDVYGLHIFNISVFQNGVLWDSVITSITIVEPDTEVLSLISYDKTIDADAGQIYINYATNWGNTTIQVFDNATDLGAEVSGEEISIWTFVTDFGLHNITIVISHDGVVWFTDVFSFTIIEPYQIWREIIFTFTSSYDSATINPKDYLDIYVNEGLVSAGCLIGVNPEFMAVNISIYDKLGQLLYNEVNRVYSESIDLALPLRNVTFYNPNSISCEYQIWQGTKYVQMWIGPIMYFNYYMLDNNYTIIAIPNSLDAGDGYEYIVTADSFEVVVGMSDVQVILDTQQIVIIYRPITIRTTSSYTGASIGERYLKYYLNGTLSLEGATTSTRLLIIRLAVTDVFGNVLYNQSVAYARYMDITVPLRTCVFTNKELVSTTLTITQSGSDEHLFFVLGGSASVSVFLSDNTYTVIHAPISPDKEEGVLWQPKDYDFTCSLASQSLDMWLDTFDNKRPLFDEFGGNILDWLTNNRWMTLALLGFAALNFIALIFAVGVIITRLPKREEEGLGSK